MSATDNQTARVGSGHLRLAVTLVVAILGAIAGWLIAPADWERGNGSVALRYLGTVVIQAPVIIGDDAPLHLSGQFDGVLVDMELPQGVPLDAPVVTLIHLEGGDIGLPTPEPSQLDVSVLLPDGRTETIPVTGWDESAARFEASRTPIRGTGVVIGLLGFVVVMWVTEAIPLFVTSMIIPVVLVFSRVADAASATAPFVNPIIVLFFAGFLMAEAMKRSGLDRYVAVTITARAGRSAVSLFATLIALAAFLSMWMSNTAAAAVLIPVAIAVTAPIDHPGFRKALILGIAYASTIGGVGSAIGTPANQLAIEFVGDFAGRPISFIEWFGFGLPMVVILVPIMAWYLWRRSDTHIDPDRLGEVKRIAQDERASLGRPTSEHWTVLAVFGAVILGWLTETWHGIHPGLVALAGAIALFALRKLEAADLGRISWPSLLTFGGGLTLGLYIVRSGASDYLATRLTGLTAVSVTAGVMIVALMTLLMTTVASNTASAAILIPLSIPLAGVLGVNAVELAVVVAIASSIDFALVVGTPPTMIAYSTRLYTAGQLFRTGIVLDLAGIAILVLVVVRIWAFLGLV